MTPSQKQECPTCRKLEQRAAARGEALSCDGCPECRKAPDTPSVERACALCDCAYSAIGTCNKCGHIHEGKAFGPSVDSVDGVADEIASFRLLLALIENDKTETVMAADTMSLRANLERIEAAIQQPSKPVDEGRGLAITWQQMEILRNPPDAWAVGSFEEEHGEWLLDSGLIVAVGSPENSSDRYERTKLGDKLLAQFDESLRTPQPVEGGAAGPCYCVELRPPKKA